MIILYLAEIVGKPGIFAVKSLLGKLKKELGADFVVANGDGTTGGFGLGKNHAFYLHKLGINALTAGDFSLSKKDLQPVLGTLPFLLRPANLPSGAPGRGWRFFEAAGQKLAVISLLGQAGFSRTHGSNPFTLLDSLLEKIRPETKTILVDFHASATAEKQTFFFHAAGRVSAVIGSHGRIQTADEKILPGGTAILTDAGRCGSTVSVGGFAPGPEITRYLTGVPGRSEETWAGLEVQGVLIETNAEGQAVRLERIRRVCTEVPSQNELKED